MYVHAIRVINRNKVKSENPRDMPRIIGVDIPGNKRIEYALRYIYGIGPAVAAELVKRAKIKPGTKANQITDENIATITTMLQNEFVVEAISDVLSLRISDAFRRSTAIAEHATARICPAMVSAPVPMPVQEKARRLQSAPSVTKHRERSRRAAVLLPPLPQARNKLAA